MRRQRVERTLGPLVVSAPGAGRSSMRPGAVRSLMGPGRGGPRCGRGGRALMGPAVRSSMGRLGPARDVAWQGRGRCRPPRCAAQGGAARGPRRGARGAAVRTARGSRRERARARRDGAYWAGRAPCRRRRPRATGRMRRARRRRRRDEHLRWGGRAGAGSSTALASRPAARASSRARSGRRAASATAPRSWSISWSRSRGGCCRRRTARGW